ncbi:MAG: helix-turn-helix transcriptional regulator, partial [Candidatus Eremiobacteraeota bacterium]|nr:helix-turn-helix transcriptional regulator [Candidatus Eremiobacteraeota bacterium]
AIREQRGIPQGKLAARLGISAAHLSRIEHGANLRVSTLLDIARELRVEPLLVPKELVPPVRALLSAPADGEPADRERGRFA